MDQKENYNNHNMGYKLPMDGENMNNHQQMVMLNHVSQQPQQPIKRQLSLAERAN